MAIGGVKREKKEFSDVVKRVGLLEARVVAINPNEEEFLSVLGKTLKEDSKATEYLGKSKDGNTFLRIDVWLQDVKDVCEEDKEVGKYKVTFFLENKERENKDFTKKQYINDVGTCTWAVDEDSLPSWFAKGESRVAFIGEEDLYNFMRTWLGEIDFKNEEATLLMDWKKLMKGNVKELKDQIDGEWCSRFAALATIIVKEKEGETKEYQGIFNKAFIPEYSLKHFRLVDYNNPKLIESIKSKKSKDQKAHEKFIAAVSGDYGCRDIYVLKDIQDYDANKFFVASDRIIESDDSDDSEY